MMVDYNDLDPAITAMADEMLDWLEGRKSWTNLIMGLDSNGPETQVAIANMDAVEVQKRSAAIVALCAIKASR